MLCNNIFLENLSNSSNTLIKSSDFQHYIQFSMLLLVLVSVFLIFNSVIFPSYLRELRNKDKIAPSNGNLVFISTLWVGFCLFFFFVITFLNIFKPYM